MKIVTICGAGIGSSGILKVNAEKALESLGLTASVVAADVASVRRVADDANVILTSQEFVEAGREHIAYEQEVVWPQVEVAISRADLEKIGEKLEKAKKPAPTRPHPDTPPNPAVLKTVGMGAAVMDHVRDAVTGRSADNPPDPQIH